MKKQYLKKEKKHLQQKMLPYLKGYKSLKKCNNNDDDDNDDDDRNNDLPHLPTPPPFLPKNNSIVNSILMTKN